MRLLRALLLTVVVVASGVGALEAQTFGFTTEPLIPVGKFAKAIDIGWGATGYVGAKLGGRKSKWFIEGNVAAQWHAGDSIEDGLFAPDTTGDGDAIQVAGWIFPVRASLTRLFGRAYFSPRVGIYIPVGGLKDKLNMEPSFGISPRIGHFFWISRDITADLALEYTVIFDQAPLMYVGLSFGFLMGGGRLPRGRHPY
jgi:hypothetical protein